MGESSGGMVDNQLHKVVAFTMTTVHAVCRDTPLRCFNIAQMFTKTSVLLFVIGDSNLGLIVIGEGAAAWRKVVAMFH